MSFDVLPDELMEKIFSHFSCHELRVLSLVNRRWRRVTRIRLRLLFILKDVLSCSEQKYQQFSFSMCYAHSVLNERLQGELLEYCVEKCNVKSLHIHSPYDRLLRFLHFERNLLEGLVELNLTIGNTFSIPSHFFPLTEEDRFLPINHPIVLKMENLQNLHWSYLSSLDANQCIEHSLALVTPQLKRLEVIQCYRKWEKAGIWTRINISSTLDHLQELYLEGVDFNPHEYPMVLPYLNKLTVQFVAAKAPLQLDTPCLNTLVSDFYSFKSLWLKNANNLRHIEFHVCPDCPDLRDDDPYIFWDRLNCFDPFAEHVTKLTLVGEVEGTPFEKFSYLLEAFPQIESLHLHQLTLPSSIDQGGPHLKKILITDCTTQAKALSFPSDTEWIRVHQLIGYNGEICVHPTKRHPPLDSVAIPSRWYHLTRRATHSTRGFQYHPEGTLSTKFGQHNHKEVDMMEDMFMGPWVEISPALF